jgi:hypothetical protein
MKQTTLTAISILAVSALNRSFYPHKLRAFRRDLFHIYKLLAEICPIIPHRCISDFISFSMCPDCLPLEPSAIAHINRAVDALSEGTSLAARLHWARTQRPELETENIDIDSLAFAILRTLDDANSALAWIERIS